MWRAPLTRPAAAAAAIGPFAMARRTYALKSHKIQAVVHQHKKAQEADRDLILKVMGTLPSPREARQFLSKFSPPATASAAGTPEITNTNLASAAPGTNFIDSLLWPTDNLALIKLDGPFDKDRLSGVANTLVQLQKLGLMSVVMLDNQTWWQSNAAQVPTDSGVNLHPSAETRRRMMKDMADIVEEIESSGGRARPIYEGVFEEERKNSRIGSTGVQEVRESRDGIEEISIRPGLEPLQACLKLRQIPVMIPMATSWDCQRLPVQSTKALVALAKYMGGIAKKDKVLDGDSLGQGSSLVPMRLIVINATGGIPLTRTNGIKGPTHCFVNLKDEYKAILDDLDNMDYIPDHLAKSYRSDLDMIKESLEHLPPTCSALITSSPSLTLITNLITDKPLFSSTMRGQDPKVMLATTVLRSGLDIFTFRDSLQGLDLKQLQVLLESSFGKSLDGDGFYDRIQDRTKTVILAGNDYMGAAIVTREGGDKRLDEKTGLDRDLASVAYLDKFSVAPKSQGIGVADILWKKLTDEFPDLVWRSRSDNPVNKWYFDRADGNIKIPGTNWTVFWYGPKGLGLIRDYIHICRDIPASFLPPNSKNL
ncbi:Amino-acid acetyltransferase, mitochondrial [Linnemannia gamsii]|uniref:Amino-acid acetyltransferase, mitochondrial n=1 Tax=Linnemannia gamsii TaxID=64522 RepID=A0ABQ7JS40_9FUNG|nr:Amino-acid acetyltransferase, mitochondrial [Linnemannia gamsii]